MNTRRVITNDMRVVECNGRSARGVGAESTEAVGFKIDGFVVLVMNVGLVKVVCGLDLAKHFDVN